MSFSTSADFPSFREFASYPPERIRDFVLFHRIRTVYLPIDGTRRYFLTLGDSSPGNNGGDSSSNAKQYFEITVEKTVEIVRQHFKYGIKNVILLLMDNSAFERDHSYLANLIRLGIYPTLYNRCFLDLYREYGVRAVFGGFNERYAEVGFPEALNIFKQVEQVTSHNRERLLLFFTGTTPIDDYVRLTQRAIELHSQGIPITKEALIRELYKSDISPIDYALYFGFPRDKIMPPMLWGRSTRFYTANPSLSITNEQILQAIYYTALSRRKVKDEYLQYETLLSEKQRELLTEWYLSNRERLLGPELIEDLNPFVDRASS